MSRSMHDKQFINSSCNNGNYYAIMQKLEPVLLLYLKTNISHTHTHKKNSSFLHKNTLKNGVERGGGDLKIILDLNVNMHYKQYNVAF